MKKRIHTEWTPDLNEPQEDELLQKAMRQKFDAEYRQKWQLELARQGISRPTSARVVAMKSRRRFLAAAAAVAVLLVAGWWFVSQEGTGGNEQLADQYLQETANQIAQVRMGNEAGESDELWDTAKERYTQKKFGEAAQQLEALAKSQSLSVEQAFLLALSYLQVNPPGYEKALEQLLAAEKRNTADQTNAYQEEMAWVRALVLYKKGDRQQAKDALNKIIQADGWYAEKAKTLIMQ